MTEKIGSEMGKARLAPGLSTTHSSEQDVLIISEKAEMQVSNELMQVKSDKFAQDMAHLLLGIAAMQAEEIAEENRAMALANDAIYNAAKGAA